MPLSGPSSLQEPRISSSSSWNDLPVWMMGLQVFAQVLDRAALSRCMADEYDFFGMDKVPGYLLVVGSSSGNMIAAPDKALKQLFVAVTDMCIRL